MTNATIALGSNLGNRLGNLARALAFLGAHPGIRLKKISSLYWTEPVGAAPGPKFLNGVVKISTSLDPQALLRCLHGIEARLGRTRQGRNLPRTVDLDILEHGEARIRKPGLIIPHPRMRERKFVLQPLAEVSKRWRKAVPAHVAAQVTAKADGLGFKILGAFRNYIPAGSSALTLR